MKLYLLHFERQSGERQCMVIFAENETHALFLAKERMKEEFNDDIDKPEENYMHRKEYKEGMKFTVDSNDMKDSLGSYNQGVNDYTPWVCLEKIDKEKSGIIFTGYWCC